MAFIVSALLRLFLYFCGKMWFKCATIYLQDYEYNI
nr:MAG TPA: hypothetical protein [Caudoviricetes sp.]